MTRPSSRREFLADVGRGMLVATVGLDVATQLQLTPALAEDAPNALSFGPLEPLVRLMQETPVNRLLPALVEQLSSGVDLRRLTTAAALARSEEHTSELQSRFGISY